MEGEEDTPPTVGIVFSLERCLLMGDTYAFSFKISSCFSHEKIGINEIEDAHKS